MNYHGIDYGQKGAWVTIHEDGELSWCDLPYNGSRLDVRRFFAHALLLVPGAERVCIEKFWYRYLTEPHQKSAANHASMKAVFDLAGIEYEEVPAVTWKSAFGLVQKRGPGKKEKERKDASIAVAQRIFGIEFPRNDIADAALIAEWGRRRA